MKNIVDYLQQLDLSETEAQIYLSLLKTGPVSVRELARTVGAKRTSVYLYIDRLMEKSLIVKQVKGSRTQIAANEPKESLRMLVEEKIKSDKAIQQGLPDIINTIEDTVKQVSPREDAEIKYYRGKHGVRKIYEEALKAKELRSYVNITEIEEVFPENFQLFNKALQDNQKIKMYEIVEVSAQARERFMNSDRIKKHYIKRNRFAYKLFPESVKISSTDIMIYDGRVSIINLKNSITGVVLHNVDLYNNFKQLFDFIWKVLPEQ